MYPGITPEFEKEVSDLLDWFQTEVIKTIPEGGYNLPWFQHGLRGAWRKLWHGNSPDNPDWYTPEGTLRRPTLKEYMEYQSEIEAMLNGFFEENIPDNKRSSAAVINRIIEQFKNKFLSLMSHYIVSGTTTGGSADNIAQAFGREIPQAIEILKNSGIDREAIASMSAAELADALTKQGIDSLPHIKRAAAESQYQEKLKDLIMRGIGAASD